MELFKITIGMKKKFYESKKSFEEYWKYHTKYRSNWYTIIAYEIDWKNQCWKEIRRIDSTFRIKKPNKINFPLKSTL